MYGTAVPATQSTASTMIVRGAGRVCGQPPTTRCCCFELRTGLIIFPGLLVADIFVSEVLLSIDLSKEPVQGGGDGAGGGQAAHGLVWLAGLHFLFFFYFRLYRSKVLLE